MEAANPNRFLQPNGVVWQSVVPRYFFHTNNPLERCVQDDEGMQFRDLQDAKRQAVKYAGQLLCDAAGHFWDHADFELTVTNDRGFILFTMRVVGTEAPAIRAERSTQLSDWSSGAIRNGGF